MSDGKSLNSSKYKPGDFIKWDSGEIAYITDIDERYKKYCYLFLKPDNIYWVYYIDSIDGNTEIRLASQKECAPYKLELL